MTETKWCDDCQEQHVPPVSERGFDGPRCPRVDALWFVTMEPVERGIVVHVTDGKIKTLVGRVAYDRWTSKHKLHTFKGQLREVVARAEAEADKLNSVEVGS